MRKLGPLSYRDALEVLGVAGSAASRILDRLPGTVSPAAAAGAAGALPFLDLCDEAVSWGSAVVAGIRERVCGVARIDRTRCLAAAHAVLVVTAFCAAVREDGRPELDIAEPRRAEPGCDEQRAGTTGAAAAEAYRDALATLAETGLPLPTVSRPFEATIAELEHFYLRLARHLSGLLADLATFRELPVDDAPAALARRAVGHYTEAFARTAAEVPEFALWASRSECLTARGDLPSVDLPSVDLPSVGLPSGGLPGVDLPGADLRGRLNTRTRGLDGVGELLAAMGSDGQVDAARTDLARFHRAAMAAPLIDPRHAPAGIVIPTLDAAYVNPTARVAVTTPDNDHFVSEVWWVGAPPVPDLQEFLVGHLTNPQATRAPLVVLGRPGSGKSVLTRMLAARLPAADFLPVRVDLRAIGADAALGDQIARAVHLAVGRGIDWSELVAGAPGALPVVLLDGLDGLLQATGTQRSDYLERVRAFQEQEAGLGRPVAVIVTSRTAVADRVRFPDGTVVLGLDAFDDARVRRWLHVWNRTNASALAARGLRSLPATTALAVGELAGEPLPLLMLALHDAAANDLQDTPLETARADRYERLMTGFARRVVRTRHPECSEAEERHEAEEELRRLGVVALAMFVRGRQVVTEQELSADLAELFPRDTAARAVVDRFFLVHESAVRQGTGEVARDYAFLHAGFGEFLVARLIVREILALADRRAAAARQACPHPIDAGLLHAATSFELLSSRVPIVEYCADLFCAQPVDSRAACRSLLLDLLRGALYRHPRWAHSAYEPVRLPEPFRHGAFSANLLVLAVHATGERLCATAEVGESVPGGWPTIAALWPPLPRSSSLINALRCRWLPAQPNQRAALLRRHAWVEPEIGGPVRFSESVSRSFTQLLRHPDSDASGSLYEDLTTNAREQLGFRLREAALFCKDEDFEGLLPWWRYLSPARSPYASEHGVIGTRRRLLLELALAGPDTLSSAQRADRYRFALERGSAEERGLAVRLLVDDLFRLDPADAEHAIAALPHAHLGHPLLRAPLRRFVDTFDGPESSPSPALVAVIRDLLRATLTDTDTDTDPRPRPSR